MSRTSDGPPRTLSVREQANRATCERLLNAAINLLERGGACTMRAVASEAGVGERTIYRYFDNLESLQIAVRDCIRDRIRVDLPESVDDLRMYAKNLFERFDANAELIVGLTSLAGREMRAEFIHTRTRNLQDLESLLAKGYPNAPAKEVHYAAVSLRSLLSGGGWTYLRISCGLSQGEVVASAQWSITRALERLAS